MALYVLEGYLPNAGDERLAAAVAGLREAADALRHEGRTVRYVRALFLPADETCLHLLEADSCEDVADTARRGGFAVERLTPAKEHPVTGQERSER